MATFKIEENQSSRWVRVDLVDDNCRTERRALHRLRGAVDPRHPLLLGQRRRGEPAKESDAMQRDRLRRVLLVLQGRQALEVADVVGRSRRFVQCWAYAYPDGGIEAVRGRTTPGRQRRLSSEQEARFV